MNPLTLYAKVPFREALEHPLSSARAVGAIPIASAAATAIVSVFALLLRFMVISICLFFLRLKFCRPLRMSQKTNNQEVRRG
jgi:hypothetical protein